MKNFVVYRSGAGSGKTFTLVKEYLKLTLHDENKLSYNFKSILAVTFTNKAASEMKARVLDALSEICNSAELPQLGVLLCDELRIDEEELTRRSEIVLKNILHHYSDLAIGTIDSFTHRIVKTFAHDLDLPVNFNVEMDIKGFYEKVIALLFNQIGEDEQVSRLLKDYVLSKAENNSNWDPERQISEFVLLLQKENSDEYISRLREFNIGQLTAFRKEFNEYISYYRSTLRSEAAKAIKLIGQNNITDEDFKYKKSGPQGFFYKCSNLTVNAEDAAGKRITEAVESGKWAGAGPNAGALEKISAQLSDIASALLSFIQTNYSYYSLCRLLSDQMYSLMLLKKIEEISNVMKDEERLVFISEFNQKISDIITNEPAPFIYERLGERYHHFLLDEFQDTSTLQWHNILPLLDNSLASGWYNLIVGDGKQSIYRWRNANVKQFASLPGLGENSGDSMQTLREQTLQRNFEEKFLNTNYRSSKTVVEFNNKLFRFLSGNFLTEEGNKIYTSLEQKHLDKNSDGGYVNIELKPMPAEEIEPYTLERCETYITSALRQGFNYGDICILSRKNSQGNTIANYLVQKNIPVLSSDSLLIAGNREVNVLVAFLRHLANPGDKTSAASVVSFLHNTNRIDSHGWHEALNSLSSGKELIEVLSTYNIHFNYSQLGLGNLFDTCSNIVKELSLEKYSHEYIRFFLDEVNEFLVLKNSSISSFFSWWENRSKNASLIIPEGVNAVKIMTIHASKGLEFPVVIVPWCNWPVYRANDSWVNVKNKKIGLPVTIVSLTKKAADIGFANEFTKEQEDQFLDNMNLLYVAFTRAVQRLHVLAPPPAAQNASTVSHWLSAFVREIQGSSPEFFETGTHSPALHQKHRNAREAFILDPLNMQTAKNTVKIKAAWKQHSEDAESARKQGIVVHALLSHIQTSQDVDPALLRAVQEGLIISDDQPVLREKILRLITDPALEQYFADGAHSRREAELITPGGEILRPDRVITNAEETVIIDYKTGRRDDRKHNAQLEKYREAALAMGATTCRCLLVYIDEQAIVEVN